MQSPIHPQSYVQVIVPPPQRPVPQPQTQPQIPLQQLEQYFVPPNPPMPPSSNSRVLNDIQPNVRREQAPAKPAPAAHPPRDPLDYATVLLTLADEYFDSAYISTDRTEEFYTLIATALGCLEAVLEHFKIEPLLEVQVISKYAQVVLEETENYDEAEKHLTRAIEVCERNKYIDIKYALQILQAQVLFKSRPKAAVKAADGFIEEAEVYGHHAWVYCLRFLQASFHLSLNSQHSIHNAVHQFQRIGASARKIDDHAIFAFASLMEAFAHLRGSSSDAYVAAQSALASARALQLNPDISGNAQMQLLMEFLDLVCCLQQFALGEINPQALDEKCKMMQKSLYQILENSAWSVDGVLQIPITKRALDSVGLQEHGVILETSGRNYLAFAWLTRTDVEILGFLLSTACVSYKNGGDGAKAERFVSEGLDLLRSVRGDEIAMVMKTSRLEDDLEWLGILECHLLLERSFLLCSRGEWTDARNSLNAFEVMSEQISKSKLGDLEDVAEYLNGAIYQGSGDLKAALAVFLSPRFSISSSSDARRSVHPKTPQRPGGTNKTSTLLTLCVLAALNTAFVVRIPSHPQHYLLENILAAIEPQAQLPNGNKQAQASYSILLAVLKDDSIITTKQFLSKALEIASHVGNSQITTLCLAVMSDRFFKGAVGDQAVKCAKAASHQARLKLGNPLWKALCRGMEAECFAVQSMLSEAAVSGADARHLWDVEVPEGVKRTIEQGPS